MIAREDMRKSFWDAALRGVKAKGACSDERLERRGEGDEGKFPFPPSEESVESRVIIVRETEEKATLRNGEELDVSGARIVDRR